MIPRSYVRYEDAVTLTLITHRVMLWWECKGAHYSTGGDSLAAMAHRPERTRMFARKARAIASIVESHRYQARFSV